MKKKKLFCFLLSCIIAVGFLTGCGDYSMKMSLSESYVAKDASLTQVPWFTTFEQAKENLKLNKLSSEQYKIEETENSKEIIIYDVKLKELPYTMNLTLSFEQGIGTTGSSGEFGLSAYYFEMLDSEGNSYQAISELTGKKKERYDKQNNRMKKWLKKVAEEYGKELEDGLPNDYEQLVTPIDTPRGDTSLQVTFKGEEHPRMIKVRIYGCLILARVGPEETFF